MSQINNCPFCGAKISDPSMEFCPYCGCVLSDKSDERTAKAISDTGKEKKRLIEQPKKLAVVISLAIVITLILAFIVIFKFLTNSAGYERDLARLDKKTSAMQEAYETQDWDALYDMVIINCDQYIGSDSYFMYRTALYLQRFPEKFDEANEKHDKETMQTIYDFISSDDDLRQSDDFYTLYKSDDKIDSALHEERLREQEILESLE